MYLDLNIVITLGGHGGDLHNNLGPLLLLGFLLGFLACLQWILGDGRLNTLDGEPVSFVMQT